jgi:hypothetical protein
MSTEGKEARRNGHIPDLNAGAYQKKGPLPLP